VHNFDDFRLYFGIVDTNVSAQWSTVISDHENVKIHPFYENLQNDIALLKINATESLLSLDFIDIIELPLFSDVNNNFANKIATVVGFGKTSDASEEISQFLRFTTNSVMENIDCERTFRISESNICTNAIVDSSAWY
jgi:hypothetical protein